MTKPLIKTPVACSDDRACTDERSRDWLFTSVFMMKIPSAVFTDTYVFRTDLRPIHTLFPNPDRQRLFFESDLTSTFKIGLTTIQGVNGTRRRIRSAFSKGSSLW
jgi:hypothetical protein